MVSSDQGESFAKANNLNFIETSAKEGTNIDKIFEQTVSDVLCREKQKKDENISDVKAGVSLEESQKKEENQSNSYFSNFCW